SVGHSVSAQNGSAADAAEEGAVGDRQRQVGVAVVTGGAAEGEELGQVGGSRRNVTQALDRDVLRARDGRRQGIANRDGLGATSRVGANVGHSVSAENGAATDAAKQRAVRDRQRQVRIAVVTGGAAQGEELGQVGGSRRNIAQALDRDVL